MMGLSTVLSPSPEQVLTEAKKLATAPAVKKLLGDTSDALAALDRQRVEFANTQSQVAKQVADQRAAADKYSAELQQRCDASDARDAALGARVAKFEKLVAEFEDKLAAHEAALLEVPGGNIA